MHKIIIVIGPTGTGKTSLALSLAKSLNTQVISADSRQVYIGADIGTNKIPSSVSSYKKAKGFWVMDGVVVNGYDLVHPHEEFSVGDFVTRASNVCTALWEKGDVPIIVGGTGFYVDALVGKRPFSNAPRLEGQRTRWQSQSAEELFSQLAHEDPVFVERMPESDKKNKQRLMRYLELVLHAGSVLSAQHTTPLPDIDILWIGLTTSRDVLYARSDAWAETLFIQGILHETAQLLEKGYAQTPLMQGMIYKQVTQFLKGELNAEDMHTQIQLKLHAYIRRQLVWFRGNNQIHWFDISGPSYSQDIQQLVESFVET